MATDFSRTLSLLRQEKGVSQRKAAAELGISQALLSHYENGIREPGLAFVTRACDYYHVSADYLLGRTLSRDGSIIEAGDVYDSSGEKGSLRGSIMATLQKKLVVNTAGVLFDQLGKTGSREAVTAAGDYLSGALYGLLRQLYRRGGISRREACRLLLFSNNCGPAFILGVAGLGCFGSLRAGVLLWGVHILAALVIALALSVAQVIHNTDERCKTLQ